MDSTGLDILFKLVRLGQRKQVCLQWIPSHVGVPGNETADELAGRGCDLPNPSYTVLTHSEMYSFQKKYNEFDLAKPSCSPLVRSYKSPGLSMQCKSSRAHQTSLARFRSGHLRSMTFVQGVKSFFTCPCSLLASPAHLLDCWGISLQQLYEEQDLGCGLGITIADLPHCLGAGITFFVWHHIGGYQLPQSNFEAQFPPQR
ncbi:RNase H domain-containing protein [Trichonephila clavipes]|uniref:RNase H domain-containing protein n=1 Tax=Trichonephila clavipes TaxID=2585209 RepID=A0A8X6W4A5_TRICX|nr:RNase H domain-containing protein [Trichonephila clavipes]